MPKVYPKSPSVRQNQRDAEPHRHLVLRIPVATRISGRAVDTVSIHNERFKEFDTVLFAKFGAPIVSATLNILKGQIKDGLETRLIVISKVEKLFTAHRARIAAIYPKSPPTEYEHFAPSYYNNVEQAPSVWFRVISPFEACNLKGLRLVSNKRSLLDVVAECRTTAMLVEEF